MPDTARTNPYCGDCGYDLTAAVDSSKCPECGRPLVDVLMRPVLQPTGGGRRYRSRTRVWGMPIVDLAWGPHGEERIGRPRGFIAIGDEAKGVLAIGGRATGVVAIGGLAMGGFTIGGMSIGLGTAAGGMAIGGSAAGGMAIGGLVQGGGAFGAMAQGGMAVGWFARGGSAYGKHTIGPTGSSDVARAAFDQFDWFFGAWPPTALSMFGSLGSIFVLVVLMAVAIGLFAILLSRRSEIDNPYGGG